MLRWRAVRVTLLGLGLVTGGYAGLAGQERGSMTAVYAGREWYQARAEPESLWRGVLKRKAAPEGPATRTALSYVLLSDRGDIPVYAAGAEGLLREFVDQRVAVYAKLVDLTGEGFGPELWIAFIGKDVEDRLRGRG